jgi:hypothetical protein
MYPQTSSSAFGAWVVRVSILSGRELTLLRLPNDKRNDVIVSLMSSAFCGVYCGLVFRDTTLRTVIPRILQSITVLSSSCRTFYRRTAHRKHLWHSCPTCTFGRGLNRRIVSLCAPTSQSSSFPSARHNRSTLHCGIRRVPPAQNNNAISCRRYRDTCQHIRCSLSSRLTFF